MATKKEMFTAIREVVANNEEMVAFIDREIELLNKKSSASRKPTARQVENEALKGKIVDHLKAVDMPKNIKELQSEMAELAELSNQRISHMLNQLVKAEQLTKSYEKKVPFFSAV